MPKGPRELIAATRRGGAIMQLYIRMYVDREREGDVCIYVYRERVTYGPWGQARPMYVVRSLSSSLLRVGQAVIYIDRDREGERERERERERCNE